MGLWSSPRAGWWRATRRSAVGFNMSWVFVDQIDLNELYAALDVKSTGEAADPYDLGTKRVPLAGLRPKDGWCEIFGRYSFVLDITIDTDPPRLARLPAKSRAVSCVVLEHANISHASLWQGREIWQVHHQPTKEQPEHWISGVNCRQVSLALGRSRCRSRESATQCANPANGVWTTFSTYRSLPQLK